MKQLFLLFILILLPFMFVGAGYEDVGGKDQQTDINAEKIPQNLLRLVCRKINARYIDILLPDRVIILNQISNQFVNGSDLIALEPNVPTAQTEFKMSIYKASLISDKKTKEQIINELLGKRPDFEYDGLVFRDESSRLIFSNPPETATKIEMVVHMDGYLTRNIVEAREFRFANWGWFFIENSDKSSHLLEDGIYHCEDPILLNSITPEKIKACKNIVPEHQSECSKAL